MSQKKRQINPLALAATLFVPATFSNLDEIVSQKKFPTLRSVVLDLEDGIKEEDLNSALENLKLFLKSFTLGDVYLFVRPRDPKILKELLSFEGIEKVDGFVLPKFGIENMQEYLHLLEEQPFYLMPSIEGRELFEFELLLEVCTHLRAFAHKILLVRFGLEDMLHQLGMQRDAQYSVFDYSVTSFLVGRFLAFVKTQGFEVSGGVYPYFQDKKGFLQDLQRDMKEGLISKTIIHPNQIEWYNECNRVTKEELETARITLQKSDGVSGFKGKMIEHKTMSHSALKIVQRAELFGVR